MTTATVPLTSKTAALAEPGPKQRISSIDILRGLVMLIMAVDHCRDFFHAGHPEPTDLAITTPFLFFTRLITHFCAPTFVLLSGVSAYLAGTRRTPNQMSMFLIKRGLWLILVEVVFITLAITLNPLYNVFVLQVIWAIGGSMILLGLLTWMKTPLAVIGVTGVILVFGHNVFDIVHINAIDKSFAGQMFLTGTGFGDFQPYAYHRGFLMAYALLPWAGVMMIGYVFGSLYVKSYDALKRRKTLLYSGLALLIIFVGLRYFNIYGDPSPWSAQKNATLSIISFLNVTKYPPSLLYLCLTLGVALLVLSFTEGIKNKFTDILVIYGNVPFFYYLCHWYLIRFTSVVVFFAQGFKTSEIINPKQPILFLPDNMGFNLFGVYVVWFIVIAILYLPCRWYSKYKREHAYWWLSYL